MFRKSSKRTFRRRKSESSDEESEGAPGQQQQSLCVAAAAVAARRGRNRGLACTSKPSPAPSSPARAYCPSPSSASENEEAAETGIELKKDVREAAERGPSGARVHDNNLLSFGCDREAGEEEFKLKKSVNTILFAPQWNKEKQSNIEKDGGITKGEKEALQDVIPTKIKTDDSLEEETTDVQTGNEEIVSGDEESDTFEAAKYKKQSGEIPDARYIQAARKKRQRARAQADFIPLHSARDDTSVPDEESPISDDDLDDHEKRIDFTKALKTQRQKMAEDIGINESDDEIRSGEDDDDQKLWEQQQFKRVKVLSFADAASRPNPLIVSRMLDNLKKLPPVNFEILKKRLIIRLESLQEVHRSHCREHEKIQESAESSQCTIEHLEAASDPNLRYRFYQEMRTYVKNLTNCFNEKIHRINELESELHQLLREEARKLLQRRQDDVQDETSDIWQLSKEDDITSCNNLDSNDLDSVELLQQRIEKREARRAHKEHLRRLAGKEADHHKYLSSDDEVSPAEISEFHDKEDHILKESRKIFQDVHKDFYSFDNIFAKFKQWREKFPDSYYSAYIGLCLQKILNPLIRLQLIGWNPLKHDYSYLSEMPWISAVEEYCHLEDDEFKKSDKSDATLLRTVIEKTIISKIEGFIIHVWDPLSSSQTQSLVKICRNLEEDYDVFKEEQSKASQALRKSIILRMTMSVEEDVFIPLYQKSLLEDQASIHSQFQERQLWSSVKLLGNILQWDGLLPEKILQNLGLDKLFNRYILRILQTSPHNPENIEKCETIIACFPKSWFENPETRSSIPQLENLCKYLVQSIRKGYENSAKSQDMKNVEREAIKMLKMLVLIRALDQTETIINECKLEDMEWIFQGQK
ncbi:intron Large complex component GCFC2 isoform X2 [Amblyraja radiata]|uniref:intron Large complex component GCFC2 isoform X2 n=1 Tax=Amblyraja radiata TaxID=386614 RepID=UPI001402757A|nr:intron Large complex component GCFC2 isoform X2 [Amblyraja radiata]